MVLTESWIYDVDLIDCHLVVNDVICTVVVGIVGVGERVREEEDEAADGGGTVVGLEEKVKFSQRFD